MTSNFIIFELSNKTDQKYFCCTITLALFIVSDKNLNMKRVYLKIKILSDSP